MSKTYLASVIFAALYPISHNNTMYQAGELLEVTADDAVFLRLSKCVREPTSDELKSYQALQNPEPIAPVNDGIGSDNELPQRTTATDEPVEVIEPETVAPAPVEVVEATQPEPVEVVEAVHPKPETVEPETVNPYGGWLKKDLSAELTTRAIEHDTAARNDELEALLMADDQAKAAK